MKKIKVIVSANGPLHFIKTVQYLTPFVDISLIQGWAPSGNNKFLIKVLSKLVGRDLSISLSKRVPDVLKGRNTSVGFPEFYFMLGNSILKKKLSYGTSKLYGRLTKKYINNADIFHVRSGSGNAAITEAKKNGLKVLVDHSIAHPAFMDKHLKSEYEKNNSPYNLGMESSFWMSILDDCKNADYIVVNSGFVKETFIDEGFLEDKVKVVYTGVREDFRGLKNNYKISNKLKILFTGNFIFRKGIEYIFKALKILDEMHIDYEMTVIGTYKGSEKLIQEFNLKNIVFKGFIPQDKLKGYLATSDIYLFPSLCEGCAASGMEAMAAGLPVIATKESGLPIENEISGLIVPTKDEDAIVEALLKLKESLIFREKMGTNASFKMANSYTWPVYANNIFDLYKTVLHD